MKYPATFLISLALISGCKNDAYNSENRLKKHLITEQILENNALVGAIADEAGLSKNPRIVSAKQKSQEVHSWREKYYGDQTIKNLISYSDSIFNRYILLEKMDVQICNGIRDYRDKVIDRADSTSVVNLNWYTLFAENAVLDDYLREVSVCRMGGHIPLSSSLADSSYSSMDSVLLVVNVMACLNNDWRVDFDKVSCRNEDTGICIEPYVTKIQNYFLLRYLPKESGKYIISGPVVFSTYDFEDDAQITNEFIVE